MDWHERSLEIKRHNPDLTINEITKRLNEEFPFDNPIKYEAVKKHLQRKKGKITYEDKKESTPELIDNLFNAMIAFKEAQDNIDTKQVKAKITIEDNKPTAVAYWGDWHIGAKGTDYEQFKRDRDTIISTDGLYFIGGGDYKDNYISGTHVGGNFEQIIQPGIQDTLVKRQIELLKDKCLALVRGCHDSWDKKQGDKDFLETLCELSDSVNLWHGGEISINLGDETYLWRCRHKYPRQSTLNYENAMRALIETQGPCDVAAEAHLHNEYSMYRHVCGAYRIMLRSGSYKIWDEHGQQLAGYKGKVGVPVVVMYPGRHHMINFDTLEDAIVHLKAVRA